MGGACGRTTSRIIGVESWFAGSGIAGRVACPGRKSLLGSVSANTSPAVVATSETAPRMPDAICCGMATAGIATSGIATSGIATSGILTLGILTAAATSSFRSATVPAIAGGKFNAGIGELPCTASATAANGSAPPIVRLSGIAKVFAWGAGSVCWTNWIASATSANGLGTLVSFSNKPPPAAIGAGVNCSKSIVGFQAEISSLW